MKRYALLALAVLLTIGFCALGFWQVERREWKLALIDRVEQRIHAEPVAPPGPAEWATVSRESSEYLRVTATGHFLPGKETLVNAVTALGGGFWVMAPFQTDAGFVVLVNRGFVPARAQSSMRPDTAANEPRADRAGPGASAATVSQASTGASTPATEDTSTGATAQKAEGASTGATTRAAEDASTGATTLASAGSGRAPSRVTGLIRMSEPGGAFLRANAPGENRWYSRDVEAISQAQELPPVAPYFIDAEASGSKGPVGGLTVVTFRNSHLSYAITWFSLALLTAVFGAFVARHR